MARPYKILSARGVAAISKPGRHADGAGLYLLLKGENRSWTFMFFWQGKQSEMGLGSYPATSLAEARELRDKWRSVLRNGSNPIEVRKSGRGPIAGKTFGTCAAELLASKSSQWRSEKHRAQWHMTLEVYAAPLSGLPIDQVGTDAVLGVLKPLWQAKPETASRLRGRIESVLDFAKARGWRSGENPAAWRGHLALILPKRQRLTRGHHAAMPYRDLPEFMGSLREYQGVSVAAAALEFAILTAARSGEALGACWDEIDLENKIWVVPAARMKSGREHRAPLSTRAVAILECAAAAKTNQFVFPGQHYNFHLSPSSLAFVLATLKVDATIHGFRSSFRDWCGNETNFPRELAEAALSHMTGNAVELSYRRSDALEKRRALMEAWANYCEPQQALNVIPMRNAL